MKLSTATNFCHATAKAIQHSLAKVFIANVIRTGTVVLSLGHAVHFGAEFLIEHGWILETHALHVSVSALGVATVVLKLAIKLRKKVCPETPVTAG